MIYIDYDSLIQHICDDYGIIRPQHDNLQQQLKEIIDDLNLSETSYLAYESMHTNLRSNPTHD